LGDKRRVPVGRHFRRKEIGNKICPAFLSCGGNSNMRKGGTPAVKPVKIHTLLKSPDSSTVFGRPQAYEKFGDRLRRRLSSFRLPDLELGLSGHRKFFALRLRDVFCPAAIAHGCA
jgi:hypothetical protein